MSVLRTEGFVARVWRLLRDLLQRIQVQDLSLEARIGLDDPADTGRLWGFVGPLVAVLPLPSAANVAIAPDFQAQTFEFSSEGQIRLVPIRLLWTALLFLLSPVTLRALYMLSFKKR